MKGGMIKKDNQDRTGRGQIPNPRAAAMDILCRWEEKHEPVEQGLALQAGFLAEQRDRQLLHSLVYGVIRWRGYLDWVIARFSSHPLAKMKCLTIQGLRVGLLQLLILERIPVSAAINETVQGLKSARQPKWLTGFVNGLLRNVERRRSEIPTPWERQEELPLAARLSHPQWLLDRWLERHGLEKTLAMAEANNVLPVLCLRVQTRLISVDRFLESCLKAHLTPEKGKFGAAAVRLPGYRGSVAGIPGFHEGLFQVQDEAAQLIPLLLSPFTEEGYLDACAGLGGKTTQLAELLPKGNRVTAVEPSQKRLEQLRENLSRLELTERVVIVAGELAVLRPSPDRYRGILVDAPCSGLGIIRRHPDIKWNRAPEDLARYQEKQLALLVEAAPLLVPGGVLVYATCSIEPEENEQVVELFLRDHKEFARTDCREFLPAAATELVDDQGDLRILPDNQGLDGFFAARLMKNK
jgi:16S rRNA (cytosine967-C5)-methyltransferase